MENPYKRMQRSLTQSAVLGLDVLRRARQREGTWRVPREDPGPEDVQVSVRPECLDEAFSAVALFMRRSSEQCEKYHLRVPGRNLSEQEASHVHRFHRRNPPPHKQSRWEDGPSRTAPRQTSPRDVHIEVAPGTYRISASSVDSARQTHVVNIPPGHSADLTFNL